MSLSKRLPHKIRAIQLQTGQISYFRRNALHRFENRMEVIFV